MMRPKVPQKKAYTIYKNVHKNDREASKNLGAKMIKKPGQLGLSLTT
jgi:hypothetical protein